ncbi:MAG: GFA family protein [Pseudomonadota bacterium]
MRLIGGCYCGALRYESTGEPMLRAQCHCRACQHFAGGAPQYFMLMPAGAFSYTKGSPRKFTRDDLPAPVTREFCGACGTHLITRRPGLDQVIIKIGTLDDPGQFKGPKIAIFCEDKQPFHVIPEGLPQFETLPNR